MADISSIADFLNPINTDLLSADEGYKDGQFGKQISIYGDEFPDLESAHIVLVGCGEERGNGFDKGFAFSPDAIRQEFYSLYNWQPDIHIADVGNVKTGAALSDTHAALKTVVKELLEIGKTVIILGGSHDLTLAQYQAYADRNMVVEATCVDALIDLDINIPDRAQNFLMEMLTGEPNFIKHYNHIGFQSYYVHPHMLETMDKLRFDCFRVGNVKDNMDEMEPVIRNSSMLSFDLSAFAHAYAPGSAISPNGFNGEEACILMRYAGLSPVITTVGIYGFDATRDLDDLTAKQISHMIWYFIDGRNRGRREAKLDEKESFNEFHLAFAEVDTTFLQSKKTGRWWMQLPDKKYIACSYKDYLMASSNEIPERWLRAQERH